MRIAIVRAITVIIITMLQGAVPVRAGSIIGIESIDPYSKYPKIILSLTVNGIREPLLDIDKDAIQILEDGNPVTGKINLKKIPSEHRYLYLVFSIDSSRSISKKFLASIKDSAREMVNSIGAGDRIAVYRFDDHVVMLNDFTGDRGELLRNISGIERHGKKTLLYNAIYDSITRFDRVRYDNKKIIVFTDGKDEGSSVTGEDIVKFAQNARIPIYFICIKNNESINSMAQISQKTGGKLIFSNIRDNVPGMYRTILSVMKNRYEVQYRSNLHKDDRQHTIEVRFNKDDLRDRDVRAIYITRTSGFNIADGIYKMGIPGVCVLLCILLVAVMALFIIRERQQLNNQLALQRELLEKIQAGGEPMPQMLSAGEMDTTAIGDGRVPRAWLLQKSGNDAGKKYELRRAEITLGKGGDNSIIINDSQLSEHHAKIKAINGSYHLFDLLSDGGIYLNGKKLLRPRTLHDWDEIVMGKTVLIFRGSSHPS